MRGTLISIGGTVVEVDVQSDRVYSIVENMLNRYGVPIKIKRRHPLVWPGRIHLKAVVPNITTPPVVVVFPNGLVVAAPVTDSVSPLARLKRTTAAGTYVWALWRDRVLLVGLDLAARADETVEQAARRGVGLLVWARIYDYSEVALIDGNIKRGVVL